MSEKKSCFIVTPIGDENTAIRRHIDGIIDQAIIPAIAKEFEIKVAHREYEIGSINDRVIQNVCNSDLVIANLTGLNPNVMFEIAIRYSFGKPAIVIAEKGTKLPFDIIDENTIFYINDPAGAADLKEIIRQYTERINWKKCEYGPVFSAIKKAAAVNAIETEIPEEGTQKAFTFLAEKIDNLEYMIRKYNYSVEMEKINKLKFILNDSLKNELDWDEMLQEKHVKYRVHEIAKKLGVSNKEVLDVLSKLELPAKNHMSIISDDQIRALLNYMEKRTFFQN